mmetsp:Transcript_59081/g.149669  ORF Transcript_59081/g.149669 Transcript_59081/m.149669 type:complete len:85 (+) Transcript_59081:536-790(+)
MQQHIGIKSGRGCWPKWSRCKPASNNSKRRVVRSQLESVEEEEEEEWMQAHHCHLGSSRIPDQALLPLCHLVEEVSCKMTNLQA